MLMVSTSLPKGIAYVETKNLDGETNLKIKQANKDILEHVSDEKDFAKLDGEIVCEKPN